MGSTGRVVVALVLLLAGCSGAAQSPQPVRNVTAQSVARVPTLTPIPGIKATLTALPHLPPMSPEQARPFLDLRQSVELCDAYHPNRKTAILQQIDYVVNPAMVPKDFVLLYGDAWQGRLIWGAAYLSALEWKLAGRDRAGCLYPIGVSFNALLSLLGQQTFPEFD